MRIDLSRCWPPLLVGLLVFLVQGGIGGQAAFHYDDEHAVVDNPHIRSLASAPAFFTDPATFSVDPERGMYRPVLLLSYAAGHALHGGGAGGYLRTNRLLHAVNAILVGWVAVLLSGRPGPGWLAGLLFGLHPVVSEPAHYVSARSDSLVALGFLLAVGLWLRADRRGRGRWASWLAAAAALFTKATAVALPPVLLLLDVSRGVRRPAELARRHGPVWAAALLYLAASWSSRFLPRSLDAAGPDRLEHLLTQVKAAAWYVRVLVWPVGGSVHPAFAAADGAAPAVWAAGVFGLGLLAAGVGLWRRGARRLVWAGAWAGLALLPVMVVPLNVLVNERRAYLPLAAAAVGLALLCAHGRRPTFGAARPRWPRRLLAAAAVAGLALLSLERGSVWASELSLWQDAVDKGPRMARARLQLGDAHLRAAGGAVDPAGAARHQAAARAAYEAVIELEPAQELLALQAHTGLALIETDSGDPVAARARLEGVLARHPDHVDALVNLGNLYYRRARRSRGADTEALSRAMVLYRRALERSPNRPAARLNLGACYHLAGDLDAAQAEYQAVLRLDPDNGVAALNLGSLYMQRARQAGPAAAATWRRQAAAAFERALEQLPASAAARQGLAAARAPGAAAGGGGR